MSSFGSDTPLILLAKLQVKEDKVAEYLEIADKTDKAVEAKELVKRHYTFDQVPDDPLRFVSSEVYKMIMFYWELIFLLNFTEL